MHESEIEVHGCIAQCAWTLMQLIENGKIPSSETELEKMTIKLQTVQQRLPSYTRNRTVDGAPFIECPTVENGYALKFCDEHEGFPLPATEEELKLFDCEVFEDYIQTVDVQLGSGAQMKKRQQKIQAPLKPKFFDRFISGVGSSRKGNKHKQNGLINFEAEDVLQIEREKFRTEENDDGTTNVERLSVSNTIDLNPCSVDSTKCFIFYSGKVSTIELTNGNSPTSVRSISSTPNSLTISGIVKQRLQDLQKFSDSSHSVKTCSMNSKSQSTPTSPQYPVKTLNFDSEKFSQLPPPDDKLRRNSCGLAQNETLTSAIMEKGYVKTLVQRINVGNSMPLHTSTDTSQETLAADVENNKNGINEPEDVVDTNKDSQKENLQTPEGSPTLKQRKDHSDSICNGHQEQCTQSVLQLIQKSWPDSDHSSNDTDDSDDSDIEDEISVDEEEEEQNIHGGDKLYRIADELLKTERAYVSRLHLLAQVFCFKVQVENQAHNFFPPDVIPQMFSNVKSLFQFHNDFLLPELESRMKNWSSESRIGDLMKKNAPFLKLYTEYVKNFGNATSLLNLWMEKSPKFAVLVKSIQKSPECGHLSLQHHMLEPVQRVPRYELLLKDYLRHLPEDSLDRADAEAALELVTEAASDSNEAMMKIEKFSKLLQVHQSLGSTLDLISPTREFIKEGKMTKLSAKNGEKQDRYLFLFNDLLLVCSEHLRGTYRVRAQLKVEGMKIREGQNLNIANTFFVSSKQRIVELLDESPSGQCLGWYDAIAGIIQRFRGRQPSICDTDELIVEAAIVECEIGKRAPIWIKDDAVTMCMICESSFKAFKRRHHCRACGKIVCGRCSGHKITLKYDDPGQQNRVCKKCYKILTKGENKKQEDLSGETPSKKKGILQIPASNPAVYAGYLNVSTDRGRSWCRRWYSLQEDFVMYTFKAHEDVLALFTIPLPGREIEKMDNLERPFVFKLHHKNRDVYYFQTENYAKLKEWVSVLEQMVQLQLPGEKLNIRLSSHSNTSSSSASSENPL